MNRPREVRHHLRIIAGRHRGRKLAVLDQPTLRPSPNRVRETVGNWLQFELPGAHLFDAFAGSGAMGLEALSRGAASVLFSETSAKAAKQIRDTLASWKEAHGRVLTRDAMRLPPPAARYDIIFLDPPFPLFLHQAAVDKFACDKWLEANGKLYLEMPFPASELVLPPGWQWLKSARAGQVCFGLVARKNR